MLLSILDGGKGGVHLLGSRMNQTIAIRTQEGRSLWSGRRGERSEDIFCEWLWAPGLSESFFGGQGELRASHSLETSSVRCSAHSPPRSMLERRINLAYSIQWEVLL